MESHILYGRSRLYRWAPCRGSKYCRIWFLLFRFCYGCDKSSQRTIDVPIQRLLTSQFSLMLRSRMAWNLN